MNLPELYHTPGRQGAKLAAGEHPPLQAIFRILELPEHRTRKADGQKSTYRDLLRINTALALELLTTGGLSKIDTARVYPNALADK